MKVICHNGRNLLINRYFCKINQIMYCYCYYLGHILGSNTLLKINLKTEFTGIRILYSHE